MEINFLTIIGIWCSIGAIVYILPFLLGNTTIDKVMTKVRNSMDDDVPEFAIVFGVIASFIVYLLVWPFCLICDLYPRVAKKMLNMSDKDLKNFLTEKQRKKYEQKYGKLNEEENKSNE